MLGRALVIHDELDFVGVRRSLLRAQRYLVVDGAFGLLSALGCQFDGIAARARAPSAEAAWPAASSLATANAGTIGVKETANATANIMRDAARIPDFVETPLALMIPPFPKTCREHCGAKEELLMGTFTDASGSGRAHGGVHASPLPFLFPLLRLHGLGDCE